MPTAATNGRSAFRNLGRVVGSSQAASPTEIASASDAVRSTSVESQNWSP
jgi:hypothetical protein